MNNQAFSPKETLKILWWEAIFGQERTLNQIDLKTRIKSFGDNYAKLRDIKKKYDPQTLFRFNQNIEPV